MFPFIPKNCRCLLSLSRGFPRRGAAAAGGGLAARFMRDRSGAYAVMFGLMSPVFIGTLALGSETGLWYATQAKMQDAADSAAISAAVGSIGGDTNWTLQADATAASNGFVDGSNGTVVTVNNPPKSGPNTGTAGDIEVIIKQPQKLSFSSLFLKSPVVVQARAVAGPPAGVVCVLALNKSLLLPGITVVAAAAVEADQCNIADNSPSPLALTEAALASITAQKVNVVGGYVDVLGSMTTTQGVHTGSTPTQDPFSGTAVPAGAVSGPCNPYSASYGQITGPVTLSPGHYCGGINVKAGTVTLSAGTYYLDMGFVGTGLVVASGGTVTDNGAGVTIVITSSGLLSNILNVDLGGLVSGGVINLTAPTSGPFANLVVFVDPGALLSVPTFRGGTQNNFVGTIYAPGSQVVYLLGSGTKTGQCTRLIADTIIFGLTGASFSKCAVTSASAAPAQLLE